MKTKILFIAAAFLMAINLHAQAPEKFNYQGIARDNNGQALANQALGLRISILNPSNTALYVEEHNASTNDFGLYNIVIGEGTPVTGTMGGVNWAGNTKKIKVEIDPNGGTSYTSLGTTELLSVPYALYAAGTGASGWNTNGNSAGNNDFVGTTNNQDLRFKVNDEESGVISSGAPRNTAMGYHALEANTAGDDNAAFGHNALKTNTDGNNNTAIGAYSMEANISGDNNVAVGNAALIANTQGDFNTAVGNAALGANTTGANNIAVGSTALDANTIGGLNVAVGVNALGTNTSGNENTAVGTSAMAANVNGDYNVAVGRHALKSSSVGFNNTALGYQALYTSNLASDNTAVGSEALHDNTIGSKSVAVGVEALDNNTSGYENVAMGYMAMDNNITGFRNVAIGTQALEDATNEDYNVAIGYRASQDFSITYPVGNNNVVIGANTSLYNDNNILIGYGINATNGDDVIMGNSSHANYTCYAPWSVVSDIRFKTDVRPQAHGLDFILKLDPIMYHYDVDKQNEFIHGKERAAEIFPQEEWADNIAKKESIWYSGFSAQQVAQAAEEIGYDFSGVHIPEGEKEMYSLAYSEFVVPLVKAVQEQQQIIEEQEQRIQDLEQKVAKLIEAVQD
jgi:hypothetical protein